MQYNPETARKIINFVVPVSTGFTLNNIISNNVSPRSLIQKLEVAIGSFAISSAVNPYATKAAIEMHDEIYTAVQAIAEKVKK